MSKFTPDLATPLKPITDLLKADVAWYWGLVQQQAFDNVKSAIAKTHFLAYYDPALPTAVNTDASSFGLGATILQQ